MRHFVLFALALLLCSSGAFCQLNSTTIEELKASALQALVVDSSAKLESYRFSLDLEQNIDLVNLSSGEAQQLYTRSFGFGSANMTDRALKLAMASLTYAKGDEENSTSIALEEYLINDTIYLKVDGNWTSLKMPLVASAWSMQNTMEQQVDMLNQSNLSLMGSEIVEGQDCYKVVAEIDMSSFANQLSGQVASYVPIESMNYTDLFRNMTLNVYYWITKDTHLLKKTDVVENFSVTPQSLGLPASGPESQEMRINSKISMLFSGFNESVKIDLPAEAEQASAFPLNLLASSEAVPVSLTGNETMLNETMLNETMLNETMLNETMLMRRC